MKYGEKDIAVATLFLVIFELKSVVTFYIPVNILFCF